MGGTFRGQKAVFKKWGEKGEIREKRKNYNCLQQQKSNEAGASTDGCWLKITPQTRVSKRTN